MINTLAQLIKISYGVEFSRKGFVVALTVDILDALDVFFILFIILIVGILLLLILVCMLLRWLLLSMFHEKLCIL